MSFKYAPIHFPESGGAVQLYGQKQILKTIKMELKTINEIIAQNFKKAPNLEHIHS